jgi:hypothetical protein
MRIEFRAIDDEIIGIEEWQAPRLACDAAVEQTRIPAPMGKHPNGYKPENHQEAFQ